MFKKYCPGSIPIDSNPKVGKLLASTAIDLINSGRRTDGLEALGLASQLSASSEPLESAARLITRVHPKFGPARDRTLDEILARRLRRCSGALAKDGSARAWQLEFLAEKISPQKGSPGILEKCRPALPFEIPTSFLSELSELKSRAWNPKDPHARDLFLSLAIFEKVVTAAHPSKRPPDSGFRSIPIDVHQYDINPANEVEWTLHKNGWQAESARLFKSHLQSDPHKLEVIRDFLAGAPPAEDLPEETPPARPPRGRAPEPSPQPGPPRTEAERRYPVGHFFYCEGSDHQEIPAHLTVAPPPVGKGLEFHFWLDPSIQGIPFSGSRPSVSPPEDAVYPMPLQVDAFSADGFRIENPSCELVLHSAGPTERARFRLTPMKAGGPASIFIFLRHEGTLIGVFRVSAELSSSPGPASAPQLIEIGYLSSDWFRIGHRPPTTQLTLYFCRDLGGICLFTLAPGEFPYRNLRVSANEIYSKTTGFYVKLHEIALQYSRAAETSTHFDKLGAGDSLAKFGFNLFATIFPASRDPQLMRLRDLVKGLPTGAMVTIAIAPEARDVVVPWNLMYDADPPREPGSHAVVDRFWGARFRLNVRFAASPNVERTPHGKVRAARLWHKHEQARLLARALKPLDGRIRWQRLRVKGGRIPELALSNAELVHFFCHGNSAIDGLEEAKGKLNAQFKSHVDSIQGPHTTKEYLQKLESISDGPSQSIVYVAEGTASLDLMRVSGISLAASPIVILSMCESAQVTCSGLGFVPFFLEAGAQAAIGTEAASPWHLSAAMDGEVIRRLLEGETVGDALFAARVSQLQKGNILSLIYSMYGDANARLPGGSDGREKQNESGRSIE